MEWSQSFIAGEWEWSSIKKIDGMEPPPTSFNSKLKKFSFSFHSVIFIDQRNIITVNLGNVNMR